MIGEVGAMNEGRSTNTVLPENMCAATLTASRTMTVVVERKWLVGIRGAIESEVQRLTHRYAGRVTVLEERHPRPPLELEREVGAFGVKVEGHLIKMRAVWGCARKPHTSTTSAPVVRQRPNRIVYRPDTGRLNLV